MLLFFIGILLIVSRLHSSLTTPQKSTRFFGDPVCAFLPRVHPKMPRAFSGTPPSNLINKNLKIIINQFIEVTLIYFKIANTSL